MIGENMRVKVVADDLGLTRGINYAIYDAIRNGIVTSVSLIVNTQHTGHAYDLIEGLSCSIGLCLNAVYGKAVSSVDTLVEFDFLKPEHDYEAVKDDLYLEFEAQVLKAQSMGIIISHLTTYNDEHLNHDVVNQILIDLGDKYNIPVRQLSSVTDVFKERQATFDTLYQLFCQKLDYIELKVRPGFLDGHLINISSYREWRMVEHSVLTSPIVMDMVQSQAIDLVS